MQIALCDDVMDYNDELKSIVVSYMKLKNVIDFKIEVFTSGVDLLSIFMPKLFDMIFLDVDMPKIDGFEVADEIIKIDNDVYIIFITNMDSEIKKGYHYNAKDYLSKPVNKNEIHTLMDRLINEKLRNQSSGFYSIKIKNNGTEFIRLQDILYFESSGHDVIAKTLYKNFVFINKLDTVEEDLSNKGFVRIHKSFLVNMEHVFKTVGNKVILKKADELPISRKYVKVINNAFDEWTRKKWML